MLNSIKIYRIQRILNTMSQQVVKLLMLAMFFAFAQPIFSQNAAARYEIDAKRIGVSPTDKDALPRGREFLRLDSTYYVGWMYQGLYLNDRSGDIVGYKRSLPFLHRAFVLLEKDFTPLLKTLYTDPMLYMQNNQRYNDFLVLASRLRENYEFLEMPDSAMWVLNQVEKKKFRRDFFATSGMKAWIIHRNRFFTHSKYSFLSNSVAENEKLALEACYNGFAKIKRNQSANNLWFGDGHSIMDRHSIYHYLALIHCYLKNYDSSEYYYQQMATAGTVSNNNYGSMKAEIGDFSPAIELYKKDQYKYGNVKYLMEPFYYLPLLQVYAGQTKEAMRTASEAIRYSNSSPGFGWYNIALSRSYLYNGQLDSASLTLDKAASFQEIHIGTTLTQQQYDFSIGLLRLVLYNQRISRMKFFEKGWWYNPVSIYQMAVLQAQKYTHEYVLATQLALNPERVRIIYDLFCGESTVSFDEIYFIMRRFSPTYFKNLMDAYLMNDPRPNIKRYFQFYSAKLGWETGKKLESANALEELISTVRLDTAHEKLFLGRVYESLAHVYEYREEEEKKNQYLEILFEIFPQLIPYSGIKPSVYLTQTGDEDEVIKKVMNELKESAIHFTDKPGANVLAASVSFRKKGIKYEVSIQVSSSSGKMIVKNERFLFTEPTHVGNEVALRLFGIGGPIELEPAPAAKAN